MVLLYPELFTIREYYIEVETGGEYCRGATVADVRHITQNPPNASAVMDLDREKFMDHLIRAVEVYR
jgi:pyrimidine-specific ribonucleoside hydrolase